MTRELPTTLRRATSAARLVGEDGSSDGCTGSRARLVKYGATSGGARAERSRHNTIRHKRVGFFFLEG